MRIGMTNILIAILCLVAALLLLMSLDEAPRTEQQQILMGGP